MHLTNPESQINLDESAAYASACYAGMDLILKAFDNYHATIETTLYRFPKAGRAARDKALYQLWLRTYAWLQSTIKLNQPRDYQAVATACRAVFELLVDVALIYKSDGDRSALKMLAYADSEKLEVCRKRVDFFKARGIAIDPVNSIPARFYAQSRSSIETMRNTWWGRSTHPRRWTGSNTLKEDVLEVERLCGAEMDKDLTMSVEQFYETEYKKLNWHIHSGLASTWNMPAESYHIWAAFSFRWLGEFAFVIAKMILVDIGMPKGFPQIREHWEAIKKAQRKEFADKMSEFL